MKKLLLFLLFTISASAQFAATYPPFEVCDDNNDQFAVFDLSSMIPMILSGENPNNYTVTFHQTLTDAHANAAAIVPLNAYVNIAPAVQTLYIRITNNTTAEYNLATINLRVLPRPTANPASLFFCDMMELAIYNLHNADNEILGGAVANWVTYHETLMDAETGANPIADGIYIPLVTGQQILYARVSGPSGCFNITTLTLNTHNCVACPAPTNLMATNISDTSITLTWNAVPGSIGMIFYNILVVPFGSPEPTPATQGSYTALPTNNPFTISNLVPGQCYSVYIRSYCDSTNFSEWSAPLNTCFIDCAQSGQCAEVVVLNAFLDNNNNGIKDNDEANFNYGNFVYQVNNSGNDVYGYSNNGLYNIFDTDPANSYDIRFEVNDDLNAYYGSTVTHENVTLPDGSGANYLYFPVTVLQQHTDAQISITPLGQPRPGFNYSLAIYYRNGGTQTIPSGTITFTKGSNVSIATVFQSGAIVTPDGFTYNFTNLGPFEGRYIQVALTVPTIPTVSLGELVANSVSIQTDNDTDTSNDIAHIIQSIVGSYDPNDKSEAHGGKIVHSEFGSNDYLYYTIQFENTGTASAEFIRIEDVLDAQLDESSFEMINASHNVNTKRDGNLLTWHFYDVNLPPTVTHPVESHGYITFRIKPKAGFAIGDIIPNAASIYFDYNPPIVTEPYNTEFVQSMGNPAFDANTILMYPNPTADRVTISSNSIEKITAVSIYEVTGKKIHTSKNEALSTVNIDISRFSKGIYLVEITSESNLKLIKKLIIK
ncbi:MAG: T9SS type A sorting domain-containing protein [Flavobacterium sp.]